MFNVDLIETLEELDPSLRQAFIKVLKVLDKSLGEVVRRDDFLNLSTVVAELAHGQSRMQEALTQLAEAQRRTEERVEELAQAQKRTEQRLEELAQAQKRTEETMLRGFKELRDLIAALGGRWGLQTEEVFRETVKNLMDKAGYVVSKGHYGDREVDVIIRDGEHILLEMTSRVKKADVALYNRSAEDYRAQTGIVPRIMLAAIYVPPSVMREILNSPIPMELVTVDE